MEWNKNNNEHYLLETGSPKARSVSGRKKKKKVFGLLPSPPNKRGQVKYLNSKPEILTVSCRLTWDWSERVNFYSRQIMVLPRNTKTFATHSGPGPPSGPPSPGNLYRLPHPSVSPALVSNNINAAGQSRQFWSVIYR